MTGETKRIKDADSMLGQGLAFTRGEDGAYFQFLLKALQIDPDEAKKINCVAFKFTSYQTADGLFD